MAKYLMGSDGKIAAKIIEKSDESKAKRTKPFEAKSSKAKEAAKTLGKAAARAWSVLASYKSKARKALKK